MLQMSTVVVGVTTLKNCSALTSSLSINTIPAFRDEVSMLKKLFRPYPIAAISTFLLPVLIKQVTPPWPGNLIASLTFVVLAIAALALERQERGD